MRLSQRLRWIAARLILPWLLLTSLAHAAPLRIGAQVTGALGWELAYMKAHGLDKAAGLDIEVTDLATTEAGKVAMASGAVDIILSDWLWVARERSLGRRLTFVPFSSALGALMVKGDAVSALADLKGRSLGVSGGPLDKSWLMLQAYARRRGLDLAAETHVAYASPSLVNQKVATGEFDAALQFWTFCLDLQMKGFHPLLEVADIEKALGASAPVAMVGFVFDEGLANKRRDELARFLTAAGSARDALGADASAWPDIVAHLGEKDPRAAELFRARYVAGAPRRPIAEEEADARRLFHALAEIGGDELTGAARELDPGVYYKPGA